MKSKTVEARESKLRSDVENDPTLAEGVKAIQNLAKLAEEARNLTACKGYGCVPDSIQQYHQFPIQ